MKRRNFLSGLLAAPLALKARLARFFGRKPVELCNAPAANFVLVRMRPDVRSHGRLVLDMLAKSSDAHIKELRVQKFGPKSNGFSVRSEHITLNRHAFIIGLDQPIGNPASVHCCLPRGHKGPHVLLNPR